MSCSLCEVRKEKRFCPAIHGRICPQCCGEKREVTIDCPSDCAYLRQAHEHEKPRPMADLDPAALFPAVEIEQAFLYQHEQLILGLSFALANSVRRERALNDQDLILALASITRSYETLVNSGLHYEAPSANPLQQVVAAEIQKMVAEYRQLEQQQVGYARLKDSEILKALVFLTRMAHGRTSGRPKSRAFVEFVLAQFPEKSGVAAPEQAASRIIVP